MHCHKYRKIAIVTIYNPDKDVINNLKIISLQVDKVIVCDNSKIQNKKIFQDDIEIEYIHMNENLGISGACNTALKAKTIEWHDDDFVILFDQDSMISEGHVEALCKCYEDMENKGFIIGILGPVYINRNSGNLEVPRFKKRLVDHVWQVKSLITSSMIMRYSVIRDIGFFNEDLFLDFTDWDLCWRVQKNGYIVCITDISILNHSIGESDCIAALTGLHISSSYREYYQTRDSLYMLKRDYIPFRFRCRLLFNVTLIALVHKLIFPDGKSRKKYIEMGKRDFNLGVKGRGNIFK
jgi:rhamnosyltransferase